MKFKIFYSLLFVIALIFGACAPVQTPAQPAPAQAADRGGTLQVCYAQKTSYANLAGFKQYAGSEHFYLGRTVFNGLIQLNQAVTGFDPELAASWDFSGNKVTFHLRKDVKWHDGVPFTA